MKLTRFVLPVIAAGCLTGSASAANTSWVLDTDNTIPGVVANSLIADGEGEDWLSTVLVIELSSGSIYNGTPDSARPQDGFWGLPGFDILEWDTWVGTVSAEVPPPYPVGQNTNDVGPVAAGDLGQGLSLSGQLLAVGWGDTFKGETGPTRIANISLTDDANGTWTMLIGYGTSPLVTLSGVVVDGHIPEPATLTLMGLGGLAVLRRR